MRDFPKGKAAARKLQAVEIVDGNTGESFVLTAKPTAIFGQLAARIVDLLADHVPRLRALATKYPKMYFCDAAMVRLAEIFPKTAVITTDSGHFTVYKKFRDKPPNLVHSDLK
jgi:hypothetical protein